MLTPVRTLASALGACLLLGAPVFSGSAAAQSPKDKGIEAISAYMMIQAFGMTCKYELEKPLEAAFVGNITAIQQKFSIPDEAIKGILATHMKLFVGKEKETCIWSNGKFNASVSEQMSAPAVEAGIAAGVAQTKFPPAEKPLASFPADPPAAGTAATAAPAPVAAAPAPAAPKPVPAPAAKPAAAPSLSGQVVAAATAAAATPSATAAAEKAQKEAETMVHTAIMLEAISDECKIQLGKGEGLAIDRVQYYWRGRANMSAAEFKTIQAYWEDDVKKDRAKVCAPNFGFRAAFDQMLSTIK